MFGQMQKPTAPPPVTAKVQLGESDTGEKKPVLGKTEIVTPRVVHYTENKSPFGAATVSTPTLSPPPPPTPPNPTPKTLPVAPKPPMPMSDITNGKPPAPSEPASHLPTLPKEVNYTETPKPSAPNPLASPKPPGNLPPSPPPAHA